MRCQRLSAPAEETGADRASFRSLFPFLPSFPLPACPRLSAPAPAQCGLDTPVKFWPEALRIEHERLQRAAPAGKTPVVLSPPEQLRQQQGAEKDGAEGKAVPEKETEKEKEGGEVPPVQHTQQLQAPPLTMPSTALGARPVEVPPQQLGQGEASAAPGQDGSGSGAVGGGLGAGVVRSRTPFPFSLLRPACPVCRSAQSPIFLTRISLPVPLPPSLKPLILLPPSSTTPTAAGVLSRSWAIIWTRSQRGRNTPRWP